MRELPTGTVSLLFTDIEESTQLLQQLGERYTSVLSECRDLLRAAFRTHHGHEVDTQGDAFFVAFARATDALSAAVAAQRALATHSWPQGVTVRVRMGMYTGEPSLFSEGYAGLEVHQAARIMSAGYGGQVLLSQTTRDLVEHDLPDGVSLRDLGEHRLRDLQRPSHLYQLVIADLPADFPPLKTQESRPNNLPVQLTPLIGREQEVAAVQSILQREDVRLVTLTGPGGAGKTRTALQVAAELSDLFPDGVYFVNLAPISDPAYVVPTIAQALAIREVAGQPLVVHLKKELHQKQMLLVLDNFEQVVSAAARVTDVLVACPKLKVLATSREVMRVRAEREFAVPPLALPNPAHLPELGEFSHYAAVALFIQRAQAVKPDFQVTAANARAIAEICVRLDGLPLAIELAAARSKLFPPQALLARLDQRLQVLTSGARDAPVRQQSLRNTLAWSYELLPAEEQRLFRRLSAFVGGSTVEAIEAVCTALDKSNRAGRVVDGLASLIDKSLLQQREQGEDEPRLVMLETIREYALEALAANGELEVTRHAHAAYFLRLAEEAAPKLVGPQQATWLERLEREHANLRAAIEWAVEQARQAEAGASRGMALRFGGALWEFWRRRGHVSEGYDWLERMLAGAEAAAAPLRANALLGAGVLRGEQGHVVQAEALCNEGLHLFRELEDRGGLIRSLSELGNIAFWRNQYATARMRVEEALALTREVGDAWGMSSSLDTLAMIAIAEGRYEEACALAEELLLRSKQVSNAWGVCIALFALGLATYMAGDLVRGQAFFTEGLVQARTTGNAYLIADFLFQLGCLACLQGEYATASALIEEGRMCAQNFWDQEAYWSWHFAMALLAFRQGDYLEARTQLEALLSLLSQWEYPLLFFVTVSLDVLGEVTAALEEPAGAARLWGAAQSMRTDGIPPLPLVFRSSYEQYVTIVRDKLGEESFQAALAEGRTMTLEQALAARGSVTFPQPLASGSTAAPRAKSTRYSAGLTEREVEVLRLVAQGLTDAQVSEHLIISPRTVNWHLTSIYGKLGVSSRSGATRYAIEHHVV